MSLAKRAERWRKNYNPISYGVIKIRIANCQLMKYTDWRGEIDNKRFTQGASFN